ncbi:mucin-5AC [Chrysoperla carnea]|uniref:mucin-5AC n=1 Tax=Chrysoperla carnea TaxID=189513 RepID=UPI001D0619DA|nr:mucin-5AC [Chrysoperla carnea]
MLMSSSSGAGLGGAKLTPCTPRIDISRASSSSHHEEDSKDSTPENQDAITSALGVGFREEGTLDLRSSTEELDFQDTTTAQKSNINKSRPTSPLVFICDPNFDRQRKDSQTSEICLLSISGRTSRLSSVGSQCSDHSRISTASHLSVMSGQSRSTSPHKMLLETSFCGSRANLNDISTSSQISADDQHHKDDLQDGGPVEDVLEKVLLARKHDPREAILGEGITIEKPITTSSVASPPAAPVKRVSKSAPIQKPARATKPTPSNVATTSVTSTAMPMPTISISDSNQTAYDCKYVTPKGEKLIPGQTIKSHTGTEFVFIPLKGPLPTEFNQSSSSTLSATTQRKRSSSTTSTGLSSSAGGSRTIKQSDQQVKYSLGVKSKSTLNSSSTSSYYQSKEPEYIRIKLKPDHMYSDNDLGGGGGGTTSAADKHITAEKPKTLNLTNKQLNKITVLPAKSVQSSGGTSTSSPPQQQSLSRKSSLLRSRETISPAQDYSTTSTPTPTGSKQRSKSAFTAKLKETDSVVAGRSRSKSRERTSNDFWSSSPISTTQLSSTESIDGSGHKKPKSSVFSIFKPSSKKTPTKSTKSKLEGDSIRIPLHSPSEYENRSITTALTNEQHDISKSNETIEKSHKSISATNSEDSNSMTTVTVIEAIPTTITTTVIDVITTTTATTSTTAEQRRRSLKQNTTSSSTNEVKTTKKSDEVKTTKKSNEVKTIKLSGDVKTIKLTDDINKNIKSPDSVKQQQSITSPKIASVIEKPKKVKKLDNGSVTKIIAKENGKSDKQFTTTTTTTKPTTTTTATTPITDTITAVTATTTVKPKKVKKLDSGTKITKDKSDEQLKTPTPTDTTTGMLSDADKSNRNSVISTTEKEETSENSEHDSEIEFINNKKTTSKPSEVKKEEVVEDYERKTLVFQTDSFDDEELPYVPTTLPLERSVAVPIVPIKQRATFEMKTCPIERPRSTTPINPSTIDDYCYYDQTSSSSTSSTLSRQQRKQITEKLRISLPRTTDNTTTSTSSTLDRKTHKLKSPRNKGISNPKAWQEFADKGIASSSGGASSGAGSHQSTPSSSSKHEHDDSGDDVPPPPLPPRSAPKEQTKQWINFEEIPEKHKPPKRIQTIPSRSHIDVPPGVVEASATGVSTTNSENIIYNYVNPEDCQCECHETSTTTTTLIKTPTIPPEEIEPLLQDDDSKNTTAQKLV